MEKAWSYVQDIFRTGSESFTRLIKSDLSEGTLFLSARSYACPQSRS
jgi:hypothetical protein